MSNNQPLVSIIMPCLNAEKTIGSAISSVINQSYKNLELIVIDDGSTDSSLEIVAQLLKSEKRVFLLLNNKNEQGVAFARNEGIKFSSGKYLCFLDSDDLLSVNSIELRVSFAHNNSLDIIYGAYERLYEDGSISLVVPPEKVCYSDMLKKNYIGNLTGFYNVNTIGKRFQKNVKHEDYLMWCLIMSDVKTAYSVGPSPLGIYRVSNTSLSGNKFKAFKWHWLILKNELNLNLAKALYYQLYYFISSIYSRISSVRKK